MIDRDLAEALKALSGFSAGFTTGSGREHLHSQVAAANARAVYLSAESLGSSPGGGDEAAQYGHLGARDETGALVLTNHRAGDRHRGRLTRPDPASLGQKGTLLSPYPRRAGTLLSAGRSRSSRNFEMAATGLGSK